MKVFFIEETVWILIGNLGLISGMIATVGDVRNSIYNRIKYRYYIQSIKQKSIYGNC